MIHPLRRATLLGIFTAVALAIPTPTQAAELPTDRSDFHLFLLAGQSNMAGRGKVSARDKTPHPRIFMLNDKEEWVPALAPLHFDKPKNVGVGPGRAFALDLVSKDPKQVTGLIPCAVGGSPIRTWEPGGFWEQTKSHPYDDTLRRMRVALQSGVLKGILWHQGESDSKPDLTGVYQERLRTLVDRFRNEFQTPQVPFLVGQLGQFPDRPWSPARIAIDEIHQSVATWLPHSHFVSSEGLGHKGDGVHFSAVAYRELGRRYAQAYRQLTEGQSTAQERH